MAHVGAPIDRYVVLEHLSEGGMGAIFVGKKLGAGGFEMEVVLKQLLPEFTQQEEFIDLFLREAKLSATLDHANIIHTIDLVTAGGEYFIVMEYLPGGDLRTLLRKVKRRGKRFTPKAAIYISREVLSALAYAHSKRDFDGNPLKLIHRDVSPSNVLLSYTGEVKLTDFGIAKAATHTSLFYKVKGKIGYMSPEQAKSEPLDHRSDLYSLAVCMYEILTGERLFVHAGLTTSAEEIYAQPVPQISRKVSGLSADFDAIMQKALSIDPEKRFQTAGEFQEALMRCAHRNGLLMSAPELGAELHDACGPTDQWREDDDDDDFGFAEKRAGTEVYDPAADNENDDDSGDLAIAPSGPLSIHSIAARTATPKPPSIARAGVNPALSASGARAGVNPALSASGARAGVNPALSASGARAGVNPAVPPPIPRAARAKTEIDKFQGKELTSIINMIDLEHHGAKPLVDLDAGPPLPIDQGPSGSTRSLGSDPSMPNLPKTPPPGRQSTPPPLEGNDRLPAAKQPRRTSTAAPARRATGKPRGGLKPWVVIVAILVLAGVAAIIVAMSGPDLPPGR